MCIKDLFFGLHENTILFTISDAGFEQGVFKNHQVKAP